MAKEMKQGVLITEAAAKGGIARAKALTKEERSEIARRAVQARWDKADGAADIPKATHEGVLTFSDGKIEIPCAVLKDGRRVLTLSGFMLALGRARQVKSRRYYDGDVELPTFLTAKNLKPFISDDLRLTSKPIEFRTLSGARAYGYTADLLPKVCEVFLDAKAKGNVLKHNQEHIAEMALTLIRGFAHVGIIALVDEVTGFQYDRPRRDLEEQLKKFLSDSLRRWVRTFPTDYFKHLCRLRNIELRPDMRLPQYFGQLTNNLIYRRIAPGLLKKLKERRAERGSSNNKIHQWLSLDAGVPELLVHIGKVVGYMERHTDYAAFEKELDRFCPIYPETPGLFDDPKDWEPR